MSLNYTLAYLEGATKFANVRPELDPDMHETYVRRRMEAGATEAEARSGPFPSGDPTIQGMNRTRVYFGYEKDSIVFGRRVQTWEITPSDALDLNKAEDLKRAQDEDTMAQYATRAYSIAPLLESITLTAFFSTGERRGNKGPDLPDARNLFMDMVRGPFKFGYQGTLKLKLPGEDEVTVIPGAFEKTADRQKRNLEFITGTFYVVPEDGAAKVTGGTQDLSYEVNHAGDALAAITQANSTTAWVDDGVYYMAPFVVKSDVTILDKTRQQLQSVLAKIKGVENQITTPLANAARTVASFTSDVNALISEPSKIFSSLFNSCSLIVASVQGIGSQIESQYSIISGVLTGFESIVGGTGTKDSAKSHAAIVECATDAFALSNIGKLYTQYSFPTQKDALEAIGRFRDASDALLVKLEADGTPDLSGSVRDLSGAVIKYLVDQSSNLPNVSVVLASDQPPVIATCYDQYGDVSDAHVNDIISRNSIRNPNFPPRELSILKTL